MWLFALVLSALFAWQRDNNGDCTIHLLRSSSRNFARADDGAIICVPATATSRRRAGINRQLCVFAERRAFGAIITCTDTIMMENCCRRVKRKAAAQ
jgi:hypothetical protein